ncbi:Gibberellin 2-beta-dioxygenase 1 [Forsythia ovata]|uniref:Gibberellin 2-beta-dioxygenase 1 n=1 Tax=Forsythia ovata TaxID=205694 RepID=A0ABD1QA69_9LAMI
MVVLSKPAVIEHLSLVNNTIFHGVPLIDLSKPDSNSLLVKACREFGFFKVINHGVPTEFITKLESLAIHFFSLPLSEKEKAGLTAPDPLAMATRKLAPMEICIVNGYVSSVKKMACEILEMLAEGLKIEPRNIFSKLVMDEESDSIFRLNHYPPCPDDQFKGRNLIGFGEHTDPQIISVLRSNNTSGLQVLLKDGNWISVPPDQNSFFINVGDSLQVMTNGMFKSVRHRVVANTSKSRISMIYFGGPPLCEKIAPLPSLMKGEDSLYREFTWFEYKKSAYKSRLDENRLGRFEKLQPPCVNKERKIVLS